MAEKPYYLLDTFAERQAAREAADKAERSTKGKAVDAESADVEDKAVAPKKTARKRVAKKG